MTKEKAGLHKKVSSIFDGTAAPGKQPAEPASPGEAAPIKLDRPERLDREDTSAPKSVPRPAKPVPRPAKPARAKTAAAPGPKVKAEPSGGLRDVRQKKMIFLIAVLFIVFTVMLYRTLKSSLPGSGSEDVLKQVAAAETAMPGDSDIQINWQIPAPYPTTLRDPMRLSSAAALAEGLAAGGGVEEIAIDKGIVVRAIYYSEQGRSAVIGDEIVYEGQKVLGATVIKITKDSVEFERNGRRFSRPGPLATSIRK